MSRFGVAWRNLAVLVALTMSIAGCQLKTTPNPTASAESNSTSKSGDGTTSGEPTTTSASKGNPQASDISAEGSSTVYPICQAFAVEFEKKSQYKVTVGRQGTGGGYKKFAHRQTDIWNASRPIDPKEIEELKEKGIDWLELTIAVDGIVIAVHPQNTWCTKLTCAQLKRIWEPDSQVKTWQDLDPSWPADELLLFGADTDSGTFEYFTEVINGKKKASNIRYNPSSDDNTLVSGIASNKSALGYIPFGYYIENTEKLKAIEVSPSKEPTETPAAYVAPTEDSILSGEYAPLSRPLFMYVNLNVMRARPEIVEFLKFAVSEAAQPLIQNRGFVRVKDDVLKQMQNKLETTLANKNAQ